MSWPPGVPWASDIPPSGGEAWWSAGPPSGAWSGPPPTTATTTLTSTVAQTSSQTPSPTAASPAPRSTDEPSTSSSDPASSRPTRTNAGAIAGGVVGASALLIAMICILVCFRRRRRRRVPGIDHEAQIPSQESGGRCNPQFSIVPFNVTSSASNNIKEKELSGSTDGARNLTSPVVHPSPLISANSPTPSVRVTGDGSARPRGSATQVAGESQRMSPPPSISDVDDQPSSEMAHSETDLILPSHFPHLTAPTHNLDSGMRFREITPSELGAMDLPPTYTPH